MKKKQIECEEESYWPVLIIKEGRPYRLTKLVRKDVNNPCTLCDLRIECGYPDGLSHFMRLCLSDGRGADWFFAEDWTIVDRTIVEYVTDESTFK